MENELNKKQIEEMAKEIFAYVDSKGVKNVYIVYSGFAKELKDMSHNYGVAEHLVKQGYQKIPENAEVLSREEYERLKQVENEKDRLYEIKLDLENQLIEKGWTDYEGADEIEKRVSKETAEKIANRLIEIFSTAMGVCSGCALQYDKAKNPTAREFQFGKYKGFEVAIKEVKELAKQIGVNIVGESNNTCVMCGAIIPEGVQVCPNCNAEVNND